MIKINLLPEDLKKQRVIVPKMPLAATGIVMALLLFIWFTHVSNNLFDKEAQLKNLESKWSEILELKEEYGNYKDRLESLQERSKIVNYLMADRIIYSQKLNELSELVGQGIWFTGLKLEDDKLEIAGSAYSAGKNEEAIVGNFMNRIKNHTGFFEDFDDIELKIIRRKEEEVEHIDFVLYCWLKQQEVKDESAED